MKFVLLVLVLTISGPVAAKLLTPEEMAKCKTVAIIAGTYDPFTHGHEKVGLVIRKELPFDCVLYLPTKDTPHKISSPINTRYEMLEAALKNEEGLFYPTREDLDLKPKDYVKKIRELTQDKKVYAVLGGDLSPKNYMYYVNEFRLDPDGYIIAGRDGVAEVARAFQQKPYHVVDVPDGTSSTKARKWFVEWFTNNPQFYFYDQIKSSELPNSILKEDVSRYILKNGLYLGSSGVTTRGPGNIMFASFKDFLNKIGVYHKLRGAIVKMQKKPLAKKITINGKRYPVKTHIGSGLTAHVFTFDYDGEEMVVKLANDRPNSPASIKQDVVIGNWLKEKTSISVPEVYYSDMEGTMKIAKKVGGESLAEYLQRTNGKIEPHIEKQLHSAVDDMLNLSQKTNIKLDFSVDNFKIWNGKVYLIDAGPIPPDAKHPMSYDEFAKTWAKNAKVTLKPNCSSALKSLLLKFDPYRD